MRNMILQNKFWYDIIPSFNWYETSASIVGKWLYFGDTSFIHSLLPELDDLVEKGEIRAVKISRKIPEYDPFPEKPCVMCVFTSDEQYEKEKVKKLLKSKFNIEVTVWKSEEQTLKDWEEGGWLRIQAEINELRKKLQTGKVKNKKIIYHQIIRLTEQLGKILSEVDDPNRKAEIYLNIVHELVNELKNEVRNKLDKEGQPESELISRIIKIENNLNRITSLIEKKEIKYQSPSPPPDPNYIFVIMPFGKKHLDTYNTIKRASEKVSKQIRVERVDEKPGAIVITDEILRSIHRAGIIICDLTDERPNVYYELGYARALRKPMICIAKNGTNLHFDVYNLKTIFFDTYFELETQLTKEISKLYRKTRGYDINNSNFA